jgi:hypothetical protein
MEVFLANGIIFSEDLKENNMNEFKLYSRVYEYLYEIIDFTVDSKLYLYPYLY